MPTPPPSPGDFRPANRSMPAREIRPKRDEAYIPLAPEEAPKQRPPRSCPECSRLMAADAMICSSCGFNRHTGEKKEYKPIPCRECGYDLTGVMNATCPECNTPIRRGRTNLLANEREVARDSYRKALMGIGIGAAALVLAIGFLESWKAIPAGLIATLACWPMAIVGYALVKMFWDGIDEPWRLLALRALAALMTAAAAAALFMPAGIVMGFRPIGLARLLIMVLVVIGTLMTACEEDMEDAAAYSIPFVLLGAFGPSVALAFI